LRDALLLLCRDGGLLSPHLGHLMRDATKGHQAQSRVLAPRVAINLMRDAIKGPLSSQSRSPLTAAAPEPEPVPPQPSLRAPPCRAPPAPLAAPRRFRPCVGVSAPRHAKIGRHSGRPSDAMERRHQWSSGGISGHQAPSVVISRQQWSSRRR
jgi:hypothetical protein